MAVDQLLSTMAVATLQSGFQIVWEAIDATTGAEVTGVVISNASAYGDTNAADEPSPTIVNVGPQFVPLPVTLPQLGAGDAGTTADEAAAA